MRNNLLIRVLAAAVVVVVAALHVRRPPPPAGDYCYLLGDYDHRLTWVDLNDTDPRTNETTLGYSGTLKTDAIALEPHAGRLYGVDVSMPRAQGHLGTFDIATGLFTARTLTLGEGQGALGPMHFFDVSGLAFDPATGWLYATQIIIGEGAADVLFRVDPATGRAVAGAFGGDDYVPLVPLAAFPALADVDDIAIHPDTGQMYGILNNSREGDRLVKIDKASGALSDVGAFGIGEVEGLAFDRRGRLWATAGGAPTGDAANALYAVDAATGAVSDRRALDNSGNYEALACLWPVNELRRVLSERG